MDCDTIVEKYLLIQNPLYTFSFPISILIAIIIFGVAKAYKWSNNSYVNQILIPILALLLSMVLLYLVSRLMINKQDKIRLVQLCKIWLHDPNVKNNSNPLLRNKIDMNQVVNYKVESFVDNTENTDYVTNTNLFRENLTNNNSKNTNIVEPEPLVDKIPNVHPFPLESKPNGEMCIQNSNSCNLCSGSGQNPANLVAPIPGPQWMPQSAESVQNRLMNNDYTASVCQIK